jgi:alpha-D-xyloside xylohydrolase
MTEPFKAIEVCGGVLVAALANDVVVHVNASIPIPGVLRLRCSPQIAGPEPLLGFVRSSDEEHPAHVTDAGDTIRIQGDGVDASWSRDGQGFSFGAYERFREPSAATVPVQSGFRPGAGGTGPAWTEAVKLSPDCGVYGGGESYQGINLRGRTRRLRNTEVDRAAGRNTAYLNVPLLWSDAGWGLLLNTGAVITADVAATHSEAMILEIDSAELDMYLLAGDAPTMLSAYHQLTGLPRPVPDWAFGVWMSRSSYFNVDEMLSVADDLAAAQCPVDVMHVDEWLQDVVLDSSAWSSEPERSRFPAGWTGRLRERGLRTSVWINPYLTPSSDIGRYAASAGYLVTADGHPTGTVDNPDTYPVDFYSPAARAWWRDRVASMIAEEQVDAVLADFGEELPGIVTLADGSSGADRHNTYGLAYAQTVADAANSLNGDDFLPLCRSGTAGAQQYSAHWAGDLPSTWTGLTSTLRAILSMSLSGFSTVTCDAGGYWTPESYERTRRARATMAPGQITADVEPELYARWAQWAALLPLMRFHGVGAREPTAYPEPARSAAIAACQLRKKLQPYIIEAAHTASRVGTPIVRPMVLAHPGDRAARDADLQYLFGPDILVAPILQCGGERQLWVPPGKWTPLWGAPEVAGPGWTTVQCTLDQFPVWLRHPVINTDL